MRAPFTTAVIVVMSSALSGCVSLGEHEDLRKDADSTKKSLADARVKLAAKEKELYAAGQKTASLTLELESVKEDHRRIETMQKTIEAELLRTQAESKSLGGELDRVREQLAQTVKDRSRLSSSVEEMRKALDELAKRKAEADKRLAEYRGLLDRFKSLIDAGKLKVKLVEGRMVLVLASDILFGSGSATLSKEGKASISEVAGVLKTFRGRRFQVEGHTDNVPIKTAQYPSNWELAAARALTVVKTMVDAGMPAGTISAASFGENKPAASNDGSDGRASNRRIEIVLVPDLSSLPGFDELARAAGT
jgi:chemotaxis protein MotB